MLSGLLDDERSAPLRETETETDRQTTRQTDKEFHQFLTFIFCWFSPRGHVTTKCMTYDCHPKWPPNTKPSLILEILNNCNYSYFTKIAIRKQTIWQLDLYDRALPITRVKKVASHENQEFRHFKYQCTV